MSAQGLSSRAIIGEFYKTLEQDTGAGWLGSLSMYFGRSDQDIETYKWLGQVPAMREWVGGRNAKGFSENGIAIENLHFEATLEVLLRELRRDKTGQVLVRIRELARRSNAHWASLLSTLIIGGEAGVCYDGQYFYDTDHEEGSSGAQSNDISVDISALPVAVHGSTTVPSPGEMQQVILQGVQAIYGFKDNEGEPMNENARSFDVMVPIPLWNVANTSVSQPMIDSGNSNVIPSSDFSIRVVPNARLTWTDKVSVFRADGDVKPFIRQEETAVMLKAVAEGSELEFNDDKHHYGIDSWRNVGYGYWQHACLCTMA